MYDKQKVTIIIPAKNEGAGLQKIIRSVQSYANEIIVIDGHSTDNTRQIARAEKVLYLLDQGKGRGDGVRTGIKKATNEIILFFDADGSHEATDIPSLIKPILSGDADMVIGSRRTGGSFDVNANFAGILRSGGADFLCYMVNKRFQTNLTDVLYSFRAIRRSVARDLQLQSNGFTIEQEMVVSCIKKGYRLVEIPSREKKRAWGKSKLKTIAGIGMIIDLFIRLYL